MTSTTAHTAETGHVVPVRTLLGVLAVLLVLTIATVAITLVDFGPLNIVFAMGIAFVKGTLVLLYFMHLRWDRPFHAIVIVSAVAFVTLFIGFTLLDALQYYPDLIPGYAPALTPQTTPQTPQAPPTP
jgi:cytochrome c oxidase subunit IV